MTSLHSPCISVCVMLPDHGLCAGCGRTIEEISDWPAMTDEARIAIMKTLLHRLSHAGLEPDAALKERLENLA